MSTEKDLTHELHDRADRIDGSPITFDAVVGRAGQIKRLRRRITAGAAALAAAAVIVPTAMFGGNLIHHDSAPPPAQQNDKKVEKTEKVEKMDGVVLDTTLPEGEPPKLAYVHDGKVVLPNGETVQLKRAYGVITRAGDEYLATRGEPGGEPWVDVLDSDWNVVESHRVEKPAGGSRDHTMGAWIARDGAVYVRSEGRTTQLRDVSGEWPSVVGVDSDPSCGREADVCRVLVQPQDGPPQMVNSHGIRDIIHPDLTLLAAASSDGLVAGRTNDWDGDPAKERCNAVIDANRFKTLFETCDVAFEYAAGFSPDNDLIVGTRSDEYGSSVVLEILDAHTGTKVLSVSLAGENKQITGSVWEDDEHLLVRTEGGSMNGSVPGNLYRVSLDGSVERVFGPDNNGSEYAPWSFLN